MPLGIGPLEIIIVLIIVLIVFGPKRLPQLGRSLGTGMREFKDSVTGKGGDADDDETPAKGELGAGPGRDGAEGPGEAGDASADAAGERAAKS